MAEQKQENLLAVLKSRREQNARNQLKSILLESYEIFGSWFVEDVTKECASIYQDFVEHEQTH